MCGQRPQEYVFKKDHETLIKQIRLIDHYVVEQTWSRSRGGELGLSFRFKLGVTLPARRACVACCLWSSTVLVNPRSSSRIPSHAATPAGLLTNLDPMVVTLVLPSSRPRRSLVARSTWLRTWSLRRATHNLRAKAWRPRTTAFQVSF